MSKIAQGVVSQIRFPLGQDEIAVGAAIASLLKEGWEFMHLTTTSIFLFRKWEIAESDMLAQVEK